MRFRGSNPDYGLVRVSFVAVNGNFTRVGPGTEVAMINLNNHRSETRDNVIGGEKGKTCLMRLTMCLYDV
uniref:Uncharacterized protein n=1 Tax=Timema tahoe TaxID=61484 RepID=A0A7R9IFQ1_9NEOP|nr:unnamed protein product [Timema tahoe]